MPGIIEPAPAKLNLALHVTGRRDDGYHLLDSLVVFVGVGDEIHLQSGPPSLQIDGPFAAGLGADDDNLCLRAARLTGVDAAIRLTKNLPIASGIGGGSADAAAVLRALARMGHPLPDAPERLGADVPVCLLSASARIRGTGEVVTPLPTMPRVPAVLVNPGTGISTPQVYEALTRRDSQPLPTIPYFTDLSTLVNWLAHTRNDLEAPACRFCPQISNVLQALTGTGAAFSRMSGSGATCFGLYDSARQAELAAKALKQHGWWAVATELAQPLSQD